MIGNRLITQLVTLPANYSYMVNRWTNSNRKYNCR